MVILFACFQTEKGAPWMHEGVKNRIKALFKRLGFDFHVSYLSRLMEIESLILVCFNFMLQQLGFDEVTEDSFYCGDAAGKAASLPWYRWSEADIDLQKLQHFLLRNL